MLQVHQASPPCLDDIHNSFEMFLHGMDAAVDHHGRARRYELLALEARNPLAMWSVLGFCTLL